MKFLDEMGISEETIEILEDMCNEDEKEAALSSADKLYSSILYLRNIGITNQAIEEILIEDHHVLLVGKEKLDRAISKTDRASLIKALNEDVRYITYLKDTN